ncbi:serine hydrolase domain-containing protein [Flaviaesturariibacter amylovorans]|uniref:Beta-lactamase-related domain-containing protein n=1 Tax=Flaviaesturariibacter amylovorans TaxID=1084520 RepID=A0ABP8GK22_9BACT
MLRILTSLLLLLLVSGANAQGGTPASRKKAVENGLMPFTPVRGFPGWNLPARMAEYKVPGLSIAVIDNYNIDWTASYGLADTVRRVPVGRETMFSAGSISKLVAAVLVHRQVERGRMHPDTPVNHYLRSWKLPPNQWNKEVTVRMLLSHTGGASQSAYWGYLPDKSPLPTVVQILSGAPGTDCNPVIVNSEPGAGFRYSGGGMMVLQLALTDLLGKDFERIAQEELFRPLGMRHSTFAQPLPASFQKKASGAYSAAPWFKGVPYVYPQGAAAGLYTTATDLALLLIELQRCAAGKGRLLKRETVQAMVSPAAPISEGAYRESMGLGAFLLERTDNKSPDGKYFEHQGVNAGFTAFAIGSVTGGKGVVILMNTGDDFNGLGTELRRSVARAYGWTNFLPDEVLPVTLPGALLDSYCGRYRKGTDEVVAFTREGDYLVERINGGRPIYSFPTGRDTLLLTDFGVPGYFLRDSSGAVRAFRTAFQTGAQAMPRMASGERTPSELLAEGRYAEAKVVFAALNENEYAQTYRIWERLNRRDVDTGAAEALLEVALAQHPRSAVVWLRQGDLRWLQGRREDARAAWRTALDIDPKQQEALEKLGR